MLNHPLPQQEHRSRNQKKRQTFRQTLVNSTRPCTFYVQNKSSKKRRGRQEAMLASLHLPWSTRLLNVIMLEEVGAQKHGLDISLKVIASLKDTLECCISLVSMPCVKDLVVGVYPGLQRFQLEPRHKMHTNFRMSNFRDLPVFCSQ